MLQTLFLLFQCSKNQLWLLVSKAGQMSHKIAIGRAFFTIFTIYFSDIDPDDESTESYGRDIFNYVLIRDAKYIVTSNDIISKEDPKARLCLYRTN